MNPSGSSGSSGTCSPGEQSPCECAGGGDGMAECAADGTPGECVCGEGGSAGTTGSQQGGGGAGGSNGGTGGAGQVCTPGSTMSCYSGPPGTEGIGACQAGSATCLADGSGYGPCTGDVTPQPEHCGQLVDEDCDGQINEEGFDCACLPGDQKTIYELMDGSENVGVCKAGFLTCDASGESFEWSQKPVYPHAEDCSTAEDEDCDGTPGPCASVAWSKRFGDAMTQQFVKVAADAAGNVVLASTYYGTIDFGGGPLPSAGGADIAVAKLDANGGHLWSKRFGSAAGETFTDLVTDAQSNVILVGYGDTAIDLGGGVLPAGGGKDILLVKLDASGNHLWSKRFATAEDEIVWAVAVDSADDVLLFGNGLNLGALDLGGGPLAGQGKMFLTKLDPAGNHLYSKRFWTDPNGSGFPADMAVDAADNVLLYGSLVYAADLGGGPITGVSGNYTPFLGKLDPAGNHLWSRSFLSAPKASPGGLAVAPSGDVIITGVHEDGLDLGGGVLGDGSNDAPAMFVGRYDASGSHLYSQSLGGGEDPNYAGGAAVVADAAGNVTITGAVRWYVDFGSGYVGSDDYQLFVTTYDPAGALLFSTRYGKTGPSAGVSIARAPGGELVVAGYTEGTIDFGLGPLQSAGGKDIVVAKLSP